MILRRATCDLRDGIRAAPTRRTSTIAASRALGFIGKSRDKYPSNGFVGLEALVAKIDRVTSPSVADVVGPRSFAAFATKGALVARRHRIFYFLAQRNR